MAQPACKRYLKRGRKHRAHIFKDKAESGCHSSATEAVAVSDLPLVSVSLQQHFCQGGSWEELLLRNQFSKEIRYEIRMCFFYCLVHILSPYADFFRFDIFGFVHEVSALNSGNTFLIQP